MKLRKIMTGIVASSLAVSSLAIAASAGGVLKPSANPAAGLSTGTGSWLVQLFNVGSEAENKPATNYDIDYTKVTGARFTIEVTETDLDGEEGNREYWQGAIGGAVVLSINGGDIEANTPLYDTYNWPSKAYWGVTDDALNLTTDPNKDDDASNDNPISSVKIADYTYQIEANGFANPLANGDASEIGCMQIALQDWGNDIACIAVTKCEVLDAEGNVIITFDGDGNVVTTSDDNNQPADTDAPVDTEAPADTDAPATDAPATTGDSTKPSTNTGVESVAVVAGIAVLATGAVIVAKKRK